MMRRIAFFFLATCTARGGASTKMLPDHLLPTPLAAAELSNTFTSPTATEISTGYADDEDREWYESQFALIHSAKELKDALLLCKDIYATDPSWHPKADALNLLLGNADDAASAGGDDVKPRLADFSPAQVQIAVNCVHLDMAVGRGIRNSEEYVVYKELIADLPDLRSSFYFATILNFYRSNYVDIFYHVGKYDAQDDDDGFVQVIESAFHALLQSSAITLANGIDKAQARGGWRNPHNIYYGKMIVEDLTPVQVLLFGRLLVAFINDGGLETSSSEQWNEELKRLGQFLLVIGLVFCLWFGYVLHYYYKDAGVGKKEKEENRSKNRKAFVASGKIMYK